MNAVTKSAVSVSEMARMVNLSRARFYQLMNEGVFPQPVYSVANRRPFFDEELQKTCLEVRWTNCGINGQPVLFYATRHPLPQQNKRPAKRKAKPKPAKEYSELIDSLSCLGLTATTEQVEAAMKQCFPEGIQELDTGQIVRTVFLHLKRQESSR